MKAKLILASSLLAMNSAVALANHMIEPAAGGSTALQGPSTSGGGFAVVCPETPLEPSKVELLDLYEAGYMPGFVLAKASGDLAEDYFLAVKRTYAYQGAPDLADSMRDEITENLKDFFQNTKFVDKKEDLPAANDLHRVPRLPTNCQLEQVAFFDDTAGTIYIWREQWDKMDSLNQAALVQHELWYTHLRSLRDTTSKLARLAVAHVFSVRGITPVTDGLAPTSRQHVATSSSNESTAEVSSFYLTPFHSVGGKIFRMQFTHIQGRPLLAKTWADIPFHVWDAEFGPTVSNADFFACIVRAPDQNMIVERALEGTMAGDLSIRYVYKTGEPISITLLNGGTPISTGFVKFNCKGNAP